MADYDDYPQPFIEYFDSTLIHQFTRVGGDMGWTTSKSYECRWNVATYRWVLYVGGVYKGTSFVQAGAPMSVQAMNEIHDDSRNTLNCCRFTSVKYANSSLTYYNFNQSNVWTEVYPYYVVSKTYLYQWTGNRY